MKPIICQHGELHELGSPILTILSNFANPNWQLLDKGCCITNTFTRNISKIQRRKKSRILARLKEMLTNNMSQDYGILWVFEAYINKPYAITQ
jgi:hypothetical protein